MSTSLEIQYGGRHYEMSFPNEDCVQYQQMKASGTFCELNLLDRIRSLQIRGVYIDVGANIGGHSLFFMNHCPCRQVLAFEPNGDFRECWWQNMKLNAISVTTTYVSPSPLMDKTQVGRMENGGQGEEHLFFVPDEKGFELARTLDQAYHHPDGEIGLIKVDVEGNEQKVLEGAIRCIEKYHPAIVAERVTIPQLEETDEFLMDFGYRSSRISLTPTAPTYLWLPEAL